MRGGEPIADGWDQDSPLRRPHMRGGEPTFCATAVHTSARRPHMRGGEPLTYKTVRSVLGVVPTCVGVNQRARLPDLQQE